VLCQGLWFNYHGKFRSVWAQATFFVNETSYCPKTDHFKSGQYQSKKSVWRVCYILRYHAIKVYYNKTSITVITRENIYSLTCHCHCVFFSDVSLRFSGDSCKCGYDREPAPVLPAEYLCTKRSCMVRDFSASDYFWDQ
jgi:hypothetical protein